MDADFSGPAYSAIFLVITTSLSAFAVGAYVVWRVVFSVPPSERPIFGYLLLSLCLIAFAQMADHIRVAILRLARDGVLSDWWIGLMYENPFVASLPKVMMAMALAFSAVLKLALFRDVSNRTALTYATFAAVDVAVVWTAIAVLIVVVT